VLVGAMILQHVNDWRFEELLDRVAFDLKVRAALGLWSLDEEPFCRATLFNFQKRLRDSLVATGQDKFQAVFDRLSEEDLKRFGLKSTTQRCDSTQIGSNIREYTRARAAGGGGAADVESPGRGRPGGACGAVPAVREGEDVGAVPLPAAAERH